MTNSFIRRQIPIIIEIMDFLFSIFTRFIRKVKLGGHHHHPLIFTSHTPSKCSICFNHIWKYGYYCKECDKGWHKECLPSSSHINHPSHHHPLKLLLDGAPRYSNGRCNLCRRILMKKVVYHCSTCNFSLDKRCWETRKPTTIKKSKCHNHPLTLMAREDVSFVCNVCGTSGKRNPYVCVSCSFMVHEKSCIDRPRVININRHGHRISHTYSLGSGKWICTICRQDINWVYGAYSCTKCVDFVVHFKCLKKHHTWNGKDLDGVPEEEEPEPMFKVIEENVINHVKHPSHNLRLIEDGVVRDEGVRCELCEGPVYSDKFYCCMEKCEFILHETCANLPYLKRHGLYNDRISLVEGGNTLFRCLACKEVSSGYRYKDFREKDRWYDDSREKSLDLRCASLAWSCNHEFHPHTLFLTTLVYERCGACNSRNYVLRCVDCKFYLCYKCVSYPMRIKHRCDDHDLVLSLGEKEQHGTHWCTVCEKKIDLRKWFYKCEECDIFCHINCVLGDFANVKPGLITKGEPTLGGDGATIKYGVVRNIGATRQYCHSCGTRCLASSIYSISEVYFCSYACLRPTLSKYDSVSHALCQQAATNDFSSSSSSSPSSDEEWCGISLCESNVPLSYMKKNLTLD